RLPALGTPRPADAAGLGRHPRRAGMHAAVVRVPRPRRRARRARGPRRRAERAEHRRPDRVRDPEPDAVPDRERRGPRDRARPRPPYVRGRGLHALQAACARRGGRPDRQGLLPGLPARPERGGGARVDVVALETRLAELGQPRFRANQVGEWTARGAAGYAEMTNLPARLRRALEDEG